MDHKIITISRQYGSGGRIIGKKLADELGIPFYDNELINLAAEKTGPVSYTHLDVYKRQDAVQCR